MVDEQDLQAMSNPRSECNHRGYHHNQSAVLHSKAAPAVPSCQALLLARAPAVR